VFEEISEPDDGKVQITGRLRHYDAFVDDTLPQPRIGSSPGETSVTLSVSDDTDHVRVRQTTAATARAALGAVTAATGVVARKRVPLSAVAPTGAAAAFDPQTAGLLDLLHSRLRRVDLKDLDLTLARFRIEREADEELDKQNQSARHSLRAVRFEGNHLLESVVACRLIAREARRLADVSFTVIDARLDREDVRVPLRVGVDRDHVVVFTGFGHAAAIAAADVQRHTVDEVTAMLTDGIADHIRLQQLAEAIGRRADGEKPTGAMMLDEPL
jgi:hypothetical protein